jgi:hypothetical protein
VTFGPAAGAAWVLAGAVLAVAALAGALVDGAPAAGGGALAVLTSVTVLVTAGAGDEDRAGDEDWAGDEDRAGDEDWAGGEADDDKAAAGGACGCAPLQPARPSPAPSTPSPRTAASIFIPEPPNSR